MKQQLRDIEVNYREHGEGEAVVLVHGLAEDHNSFSDVQDRLHNFHTYAYDFRGHGSTTNGDAEGSIIQLADDLIAFLEVVSGPAKCVGYSLGGTIVLQAAVKRPDLVRHLILVGTSTVVGRMAADFFQQRIELVQKNLEAFHQALHEDNAKQVINPSVNADEIAQARCAAVGNGDGYINASRAMIGVSQQPMTPLLAELNSSIDIVGADQDVFCPRKASDIILNACSSAEYHEIENAGHLISADQPEAYANLLGKLLSES